MFPNYFDSNIEYQTLVKSYNSNSDKLKKSFKIKSYFNERAIETTESNVVNSLKFIWESIFPLLLIRKLFGN